MMTRFVVGRWALAGAAVTAVHALAWPYTAMVLAATGCYRLLAERTRRKTLETVITCAPSGTIVIMEKGPGGPAVWVRVGDGSRPLSVEAWRGR